MVNRAFINALLMGYNDYNSEIKITFGWQGCESTIVISLYALRACLAFFIELLELFIASIN